MKDKINPPLSADGLSEKNVTPPVTASDLNKNVNKAVYDLLSGLTDGNRTPENPSISFETTGNETTGENETTGDETLGSKIKDLHGGESSDCLIGDEYEGEEFHTCDPRPTDGFEQTENGWGTRFNSEQQANVDALMAQGYEFAWLVDYRSTNASTQLQCLQEERARLEAEGVECMEVINGGGNKVLLKRENHQKG